VSDDPRKRLTILPIDREDANAYVTRFHRHHRRMPGAKFCLAVSDGEKIVGVAMVGRPIARMADDGLTLEVNRVATDGTPNACSALYGAAWRAAKAMGYTRMITYTLPQEGGASLRGAGWRLVGQTKGGSWSRENRPRIDREALLHGQKSLWEAA